MKWMFRQLFFALILSSACVFAAQATETLILDPQHTYVLWRINHFGFSNQTGKWYTTGKIVLDRNKPENSKVTVLIPITALVTGVTQLDEHLKGALFFDAAHYPTASFISDKVTVTGKKTADVQGILTLRGVAKPITLHVTLNETAMNPASNKMTTGFSAMTTLNRSDFGITALLPGLSDQVFIDIEAEAHPE